MGKKLPSQSNHKPLETVQFKNIAKAPPRLQRMRFQQYKYRPGKEMIFDNFLSRNQPTICKELQLDATIQYVMISDQRNIELQKRSMVKLIISI